MAARWFIYEYFGAYREASKSFVKVPLFSLSFRIVSRVGHILFKEQMKLNVSLNDENSGLKDKRIIFQSADSARRYLRC